ncbi:hypothetical protein RRG08_049848 [Elysia crispata]|uniref:GH18 domain-containing protein n=1 Tax=Elysia crispata TaxID=231223 RepID=A0AAE0ZU76_9GAST|nr:hypothetical protein RRG08_049848 [Elysia crispata]
MVAPHTHLAISIESLSFTNDMQWLVNSEHWILSWIDMNVEHKMHSKHRLRRQVSIHGARVQSPYPFLPGLFSWSFAIGTDQKRKLQPVTSIIPDFRAATTAQIFPESPPSPVKGKKMICYFTNWAQYRNGEARFLPEDLNPNLCTHIHYAFAQISGRGTTLEPGQWNDESKRGMIGMYERVLQLKAHNPHLKVLLSVGGWGAGSKLFSKMAANRNSRRRFIRNVIRYLRYWGFDGFDIDWEYPGSRGGPPGDKRRFTLLLQEFRSTFETESRARHVKRLFLSVAVAATSPYMDNGYDIRAVTNSVDYVCLMAYDFHGHWDGSTGHMTGLYAPNESEGSDKTHNVDYAVNFWLDAGCPRSKLILGLAAYGRSFTLEYEDDTGLGAPTRGAGAPGPYTRESGILALYEVCSSIWQGGDVIWLEQQEVPYFVRGKQWVAYEDLRSIDLKVQYIKENKLAGAMLWDVSLDDFRGNHCQIGRFSLLMAINKAMGPI